LYVLNTITPVGNINFIVSTGLGDKRSVRAPVTFIPLDLTTQATKASLLSSPDFRRLVSLGFLTLVATSSAEAAYSNAEVQTEFRRLFMKDLGSVAPSADQIKKVENSNVAIAAKTANPFALQIAHNESLSTDEALASIKMRANTLTVEDYTYISLNSKDEKVKAYCAELASTIE